MYMYDLLVGDGAAVYDKEINLFVRIVYNIKLAKGLSALVTKLIILANLWS